MQFIINLSCLAAMIGFVLICLQALDEGEDDE